MKDDTGRTLFTEHNQDICKHILDEIETWMEHKLEHSDDPEAYRENDNSKIFATPADQRNNQQQAKFGAYTKIHVKNYAQSTQMRQQMTLTTPHNPQKNIALQSRMRLQLHHQLIDRNSRIM
jgi:hypothetical protein